MAYQSQRPTSMPNKNFRAGAARASTRLKRTGGAPAGQARLGAAAEVPRRSVLERVLMTIRSASARRRPFLADSH